MADPGAAVWCCAEQAADKSSKAVDSTAKSVNKKAKDVHKTVTKALSGEKEKDNKHLKQVAAAVPSVVIIITGGSRERGGGGQQCQSDSGSLVGRVKTRFTDKHPVPLPAVVAVWLWKEKPWKKDDKKGGGGGAAPAKKPATS